MIKIQKRNNTKLANLTLGGITLGFFLSYPFHASFVGGLISSGCSAGMIGGLADWFAVTALFRRPLGIRPGKVIRTEIIPQNRERIFAALADMVQDDLLSQDVLQRKLSTLDFSDVLIRILSKQEVKLSISSLLTNFAEDIGRHMKQGEFTRNIQALLQENFDSLNLSKTLAEVVEYSLDHGDVDQILKVICRTINEYVEQPEVKVAIMNMMEAALIRYGDNNPTRKMVIKFLPAPSVLAHGLQEKVKTALQDGTVERWFKDALLRFVLELKTKPSLQESINRFFHDILNTNSENLVPKSELVQLKLNIETSVGESTPTEAEYGAPLPLVEVGVPRLDDSVAFFGTSPEKIPTVIEQLMGDLWKNWDEYLGILERNRSLRLKVDDRIKLILEKQIGVHHKAIGRLVHEGLDPLTDDKLVDLIEDKAGNDLQMIRINGSVVGGLAGMLIYVLGTVLK